MANISARNYIKMGLVVLGSKLGMLFKLSWVVGSSYTMFSMSGLSTPLIGLFGGVAATTVFWTITAIFRLCLAPVSLSMCAFYIPGYFASLYLASDNKVLQSSIPFVCMILFLIHPVGYQAAPYVSYWIIPIVVSMGFFKSLFMRALGATFTAHAVGSVIWLYTVPMTATSWYALIPIVAVERITYAAGIVLVYHSIQYVYKYIECFIKKYTAIPSLFIR
jgi:hypothetical protein